MQDNEYIETQFQYLNDLRREEMKNGGDVPLASLQMIAWCKAVRPLGPDNELGICKSLRFHTPTHQIFSLQLCKVEFRLPCYYSIQTHQDLLRSTTSPHPVDGIALPVSSSLFLIPIIFLTAFIPLSRSVSSSCRAFINQSFHYLSQPFPGRHVQRCFTFVILLLKERQTLVDHGYHAVLSRHATPDVYMKYSVFIRG